MDVVKLFRPALIRSLTGIKKFNERDMFKNNFKIAIRNLSRHKNYVLINVLGMGFALMCCIVAFLNLDYKLRFDDHHQKKTDHVYRLNTVRDIENGNEPWGISPLALGSVVAQDIAGIEHVMRWHAASGIVKINDKTFGENLHYADMESLQVFNFPLLSGDVAAFENPGMIVLDQDIAIKYFGYEDPIGKSATIIDAFGREKIFVVGAVTKKVPYNSSIIFDIVIPIHHLFDPEKLPESNWKNPSQTTIFLELAPEHDPEDVDKMLDRYVNVHNSFRDDIKVSDFYLQPFSELAFTSDIDLPGWVRGRALNRNAVGFLVGVTTILSLLILLTACFNFTNTSIAFSGNRLKEIGIRKVIGGSRQQLIKQFMVENLVLCFLSIFVGLLGAYYLIDAYNGLFDQTLDMQYIFKSRVLIFLFSMPLITAILAGGYPAFQISKHQPVTILKGKMRFASTGKLGKILLTAQFSFSCFSLIGGIILAQNAGYQEDIDFGYDLRKVVVTPINGQREFTTFQNAITQNPKIQSVAGSAQIVGQSSEVSIKSHPGDHAITVRQLEIGSGYLKTLGIEMIAGREFNATSTPDHKQRVIINQKLAEVLQLESPLNQQIILNEKPYLVIGLAQNHKEFGLRGKEPPCLFTMADPDQLRYLSASVSASQVKEVNNYLMNTWFQVNPNTPYKGFLQEMLIYKQLYINNILRNLCFFLAAATLIMSTAGFFSIVSLSVLKRTKEIGIRKVFGSSISQMIYLIVKDFIKFVLVAFVIGSLLGYWVVQGVLFTKIYAYHISFGAGVFVFTLLIMLLTPGITVGLRVYRAAMANPSETLKSE